MSSNWEERECVIPFQTLKALACLYLPSPVLAQYSADPRSPALHFKLSVGVRPEDGEAYCNYTPQLDSNRDRALIAVLPGYLVDDISFPQSQAGKFYSRVLRALNETGEA